MIDFLYETLQELGFVHPLHPAATHLPMGLVLGAFIFAATAFVLKKEELNKTAYHCSILALLTAIPAIFVGITDWQYRLDGSWTMPIQIKIPLSIVLLLLLGSIYKVGKSPKKKPFLMLVLYALSSLVVMNIGFFGGELIYG